MTVRTSVAGDRGTMGHRAGSRFVLLVFAGGVLGWLLGPVWPVWADDLLAPGRHQQILGWLAPWQPDQAAPPPHQRCQTGDVAIGAASISVQLRCGNDSGKLVATLLAAAPGGGPNFSWRREPALASHDLQAATTALETHLRGRDTPQLRADLVQTVQTAASAEQGQARKADNLAPPARAPVAQSVATILWVGWLILGGYLTLRARHLNGWLVASVVAAGTVARSLYDMTVLHVNGHFVQDLTATATSGGQVDLAHLVDVYGPTWWQAQRHLVALSGFDLRSVPLVGAAVGGLAGGMVAMAAGGRSAGAWSAGMAFALWPLASRASASEAPVPLAQLALAGLVAVLSPQGLAPLRSRLAGSSSALSPAACAFAWVGLGVFGWGHMFGAGLSGAALLIVVPWLWQRRSYPLLVALCAVPPLVAVWTFTSAGSMNRSRLLENFDQLQYMVPAYERSLWTDNTWMPQPMLVAASVGLAVWWWRGSRPVLARWALVPALGLFLLHEITCFTSASVAVALRYQPLVAPLLALGMAGVVDLPTRARGRALTSTAALLGALAAASLPVPHSWQDLEGAEFQWLATHAKQVPDRAVVVVLDPAEGAEGQGKTAIASTFPHMLAAAVGKQWEVFDVYLWRQARREGRLQDRETWIWRGISCQGYQRAMPKPTDWKPLPDGSEVAPGCYPWLAKAGAPLIGASWPNPGPDRPHKVADHFHHYHGPNIRAGLYRLDNDKAP